jgi:bifunctional non-homologous end joining protein LigD
LRFAGKVGTGFSADELRMLGQRLAALRRDDSPFEGRQPQRDAIFAEPELVAEVEFAEWTNAGTMRHPSYKGLRDDKPAAAVVREEPA